MNQIVKLETSNNKVAGIVPRSLEEIYKLSETIFKSGLAPSGTRNVEQVAVSILHGLEVGLPPLQAVQKISVINGRPAIWGDAIPALLYSKGFKISDKIEGEGDNQVATCIVTRPDGSTIERKFSVQDAKQARLWGKAGPWQQFPSRMLLMRARSFAARDGAAEALTGLYTAEEAFDIPPPKDITPSVQVVADVIQAASVNDEQIKELNELLTSDPKPNAEKFLQYFEIDEIEDLPSARFEEAVGLLKKSKAQKSKGVKK